MLKRILLPTLLISSTLFACFGLVLATQGSKSVKVQIDSEDIFYGELRDVASPQLGAAISIAVGLTSALVIGWRQSVRESSKLEKQVSNLRKLLSDKDSEIEVFKLSPSNPMVAQLNWFLEGEESQTQINTPASPTVFQQETRLQAYSKNSAKELTSVATQSTWMQMPAMAIEPLVIKNPAVEAESRIVNKLRLQTATSMFSSAQSVLGLTHKNTTPVRVSDASATIR